MYEIKQSLITQNRSYRVLSPIGIVLHETADPGANAENEYSYFNSQYVGASAHAFVDWDSIVQIIPWNEQSWHAGPTANNQYIGIELCHPQSHDEYLFSEVWKRGTWLFAYIFVNILSIFEVSGQNLMSHSDVSNTWGETDHLDPISYFAEYGRTVDDFRNDVQQEIHYMMEVSDMLKDIQGHWAEDDINYLYDNGIVDGYPDGTFRPDNTATRAEVAGIIAKAIRYITGKQNI